MVCEVFSDIGWAVVFVIIGGIVGILLVLISTLFLPRIIERMTPNLDEGREIARGNVAVAQYFGRVVGSAILGISIVIAAAVAGGIIAALH